MNHISHIVKFNTGRPGFGFSERSIGADGASISFQVMRHTESAAKACVSTSALKIPDRAPLLT
jgi:hypothetical protein